MGVLTKTQKQTLNKLFNDHKIIEQINDLLAGKGLEGFQVESIKLRTSPAGNSANNIVPTGEGECPPRHRKITICTPRGICKEVCRPISR